MWRHFTLCIALYHDSSLKRSGMARVNEGSHSFTCHPHVHPQVEWTIPAFTPQPQSITALWLALISRPAEGRRLSWPRKLESTTVSCRCVCCVMKLIDRTNTGLWRTHRQTDRQTDVHGHSIQRASTPSTHTYYIYAYKADASNVTIIFKKWCVGLHITVVNDSLNDSWQILTLPCAVFNGLISFQSKNCISMSVKGVSQISSISSRWSSVLISEPRSI